MSVGESTDRSYDDTRRGCLPTRGHQDRRGAALFAKYGLDLPERPWPQSPERSRQRVERPVRMRVRWTCHQCQTGMGADRRCPKCRHRHCQQCSRYPPRKEHPDRSHPAAKDPAPKHDPDSVAGNRHAEPAQPQALPNSRHRRSWWTSMPYKPGRSALIRRPIRQRIHRTCHVCAMALVTDKRECPSCQHRVCVRCPREPLQNYELSPLYSGHRVTSKGEQAEPIPQPTRMRTRYVCHQCGPNSGYKHDRCPDCAHDRCELCPGEPGRSRTSIPPSQADAGNANEGLPSVLGLPCMPPTSL